MGFSISGLVMKAKPYQIRGRDRWQVTLWWQGQRYRRFHYDNQTPLLHERQAVRISEAINADIEVKGKHFDPRQWFKIRNDLEFSTYSAAWFSHTSYAPGVFKDVRRYLGQMQEFFKEQDIREIKLGHIEDFLRSLPKTMGPKTRKNALAVLHKIFSDAYRREEILRIPGFPRIEAPESEIRWINSDWQDKIIEAIPERDRPIFVFLRTYGVRPGEARALMWDCVDFDNQTITIKRTYSGRTLTETTKTKRVRHLPLVEPITSILGRIRGLGGPVFRNQRGSPYTEHIREVWQEAAMQVGAPPATMYQGTRHSLGCRLVQEGHNLDLVRDLFGHARSDMTRRYARSSLGNIKGMLEPETNRHQRVDK